MIFAHIFLILKFLLQQLHHCDGGISKKIYYATDDKDIWDLVQFSDKQVAKSDGSIVNVHISRIKLPLSFFEAACLCNYRGETLMSIQAKKDLESFGLLQIGGLKMGWTDVTKTVRKWTNFKSEDIDINLIKEKSTTATGSCTELTLDTSLEFQLLSKNCSSILNANVVCEDDNMEPGRSVKNFDCYDKSKYKTECKTQLKWAVLKYGYGRACTGVRTPQIQSTFVNQNPLVTYPANPSQSQLPPPNYPLAPQIIITTQLPLSKTTTPPPEKTCSSIVFKKHVVTKSTGNITIHVSEEQVSLNWFDAQCCCKSRGQTLLSINNEQDLKAYYSWNYAYNVGWTDVHGYGIEWRNLKGVYPTGDIYYEPTKKPTEPGKCRELGKRGVRAQTYHMIDLPCNQPLRQSLICEEDDPYYPSWNYDCQNKLSGAKCEMKYFESILPFNEQCETGRTLPSGIPTSTMKPAPTQAPGPGPVPCTAVPFEKQSITKSAGYAVNIYVSKTPTQMDWYEAQCCCKSRGQTLLSINNELDLKAYFGISNKTDVGWSDVQGYGKDYRNLMGIYPTGDIFKEQPKIPAGPGRCRELARRNDVNDTYFLADLECSFKLTDTLICEQLDPQYPKWLYNCEFKKSEMQCDKSYFETVLVYNEECEKHPPPQIAVKTTTAPPSVTETTEDDDETDPPPPTTTLAPLAPLPQLMDVDVLFSKVKRTWDEAIVYCKKAKATLLVISEVKDLVFLNSAKVLVQPPYTKNDTFWSGAKFSAPDLKNLYWEPEHVEILNFMDRTRSGINIFWQDGEPEDKGNKGQDLCVDIKFQGNPKIPAIWATSNCSEYKYFICTRTVAERRTNDNDDEPLYEPVSGYKGALTIGVEGQGKGVKLPGVIAKSEIAEFFLFYPDKTKQTPASLMDEYDNPLEAIFKPNSKSAMPSRFIDAISQKTNGTIVATFSGRVINFIIKDKPVIGTFVPDVITTISSIRGYLVPGLRIAFLTLDPRETPTENGMGKWRPNKNSYDASDETKLFAKAGHGLMNVTEKGIVWISDESLKSPNAVLT